MSTTYSDQMREAVQSLEKELGLPAGFFDALRADSDWAFVVKLHALVEGALAHALVHTIGKPELGDYVSRLSIRGRSGKVGLGKALGVLNRDEERFINALSDVRNDFAHNIHNANRDLKGYVEKLSPEKQKQFIAGCNPLIEDTTSGGQPTDVFIVQNPKLALWFAAMPVLTALYLNKETARFNTVASKLLKEASELARQARTPQESMKATPKSKDGE